MMSSLKLPGHSDMHRTGIYFIKPLLWIRPYESFKTKEFKFAVQNNTLNIKDY